jgi:hypothetical protein
VKIRVVVILVAVVTATVLPFLFPRQAAACEKGLTQVGVGFCTHGADTTNCLLNLVCVSTIQIPPKAPCLGDGESGKRVTLFYGRTFFQADHYSADVPKIRQMADYVNQRYRSESNQNMRWECTSEGETVHEVVALDGTLPTLIATLQREGYADPSRIYTVVMEGGGPSGYAGWATLKGDDSPGLSNKNNSGPSYSVTWYLGSWTTMIHELGHNMGAVQGSSPHSSGAGHCYDGNDLMCYNDGGPYFQNGGKMTQPCPGSYRWDCNRDDYFNPSPPVGSYLSGHWDLYRSGWLQLAS